MLKISDLNTNRTLDSKDLAAVRGGTSPLSADFSSRIASQVASVTQGFEFGFAQANQGAVTNNQELLGGNGALWAAVTQDQHQDNRLDVSGIGNTSVGGLFI